MPERTIAILAAVFVGWSTAFGSVAPLPPRPFGDVSGADRHQVRQVAGVWTLSLSRGKPGQVAVKLPGRARAYVLPAFEGVYVETGDRELMGWLRRQSPLGATEQLTVPFVALCYGDGQWVYALPQPYYAAVVVEEDGGLSVRFDVTPNRAGASLAIQAWRVKGSPIDAALSVRKWLRRRGQWRSLKEKIAGNPRVGRLLGAAHIYLWGDGVFCWHDVPRAKWPGLGRAMREAKADSVLARIAGRLKKEQRKALDEIATARWPSRYAKRVLAGAIADALREPALTRRPSGRPLHETVAANKKAFVHAAGTFLAPAETWGDGASAALLRKLKDAGIDRAVLITGDLDSALASPHVAKAADGMGYLFAPYDSYGSVHRPGAAETTWATAQFDRRLYDSGMIVKADGKPTRGFKGVGYRLSPIAAWPYVQRRVRSRMKQVPFTAWFLDVDAFGEFFDDYHPSHRATKPADAAARRRRMRWLSDQHGLVVGSEGGTGVMTDVLHFGHGVVLPHYGWGDPELRKRGGRYDLGRYWPPDQPEVFFKPAAVAPKYRRPLFTPADRLPIYQAVFGDSVVVTHHWQNGSLKYPNQRSTTALLELLYNVPPLYHLNRNTWRDRGGVIAKRHAFQSPIHRRLATAPLVGFAWLTDDRLLQRTTFATEAGEVSLVANFDRKGRGRYPPRSLSVEGQMKLSRNVYRVAE